MSDLRVTTFNRRSRGAALEAIRRHFADLGRSPTYRELAARLSIEPQRVGALLRDLERAGAIALDGGGAGRASSIRLLIEPRDEIATSELLLLLQRRGVSVRIAGSWPLMTRTEYEVTTPPELRQRN